MADKLMYITDDNTQNYLFCKLKLVVKSIDHWTVKEPNNQNSL